MNDIREYETWADNDFTARFQGTTLAQRTAGGVCELRDGAACVKFSFVPHFAQNRVLLVLSAESFAYNSIRTLWQRDVRGPAAIARESCAAAHDLVARVRDALSARIGPVAQQYVGIPHGTWFVAVPATLPAWVEQVNAVCAAAYTVWDDAHPNQSGGARMLARDELKHMPYREVSEHLQSALWIAACEQQVTRLEAIDAALAECLLYRAGVGEIDGSHWLF